MVVFQSKTVLVSGLVFHAVAAMVTFTSASLSSSQVRTTPSKASFGKPTFSLAPINSFACVTFLSLRGGYSDRYNGPNSVSGDGSSGGSARRYDYEYDGRNNPPYLENEGESFDEQPFTSGGKDEYHKSYDDDWRHQKRRPGGYYDEDGFYREDGRVSTKRPSSRRSSLSTSAPPYSALPTVLSAGNRQIGMILLGSGLVFTMLGISLFFNKSLMRIGNLLFMSGIPMTIGPGRTAGYFLQPNKARATGCLMVGILLVFVGWPVFGIILELFGLLNLFGNLFPVVTVLLKQVPIIGALFGSNNGRYGRSNRSTSRRRSSRADNREENDFGYDGSEEFRDDIKNADPYY